jgi:hypothetical protein
LGSVLGSTVISPGDGATVDVFVSIFVVYTMFWLNVTIYNIHKTNTCNIHSHIYIYLHILDDGWPESVEEQSLLLLVWRHYITKQYIKDVL